MYYNNKGNYDFNRFDYENENRYNSNNNRNCCVRHVEETFCCPSYYEEEKNDCKENKKEENFYPCYEGYIMLYPKNSYCNIKKDNQKHDNCHKCNSKQNDDCESKNSRNRCGFCGLFGRW